MHGIFQFEPEVRLIQQLVQLQNEVAAVGFAQQARLQQVLVSIDRALLCLVVDGAKQGIPVEITAINHRRFLRFVMDQQVDQNGVLKLQTQCHVSRQIGEEIIDFRIIVLLAHDAGHDAFGIEMVAQQLEQLANHFAKLNAGARLQAKPDRLVGVVQILGVAEIKQVTILAIGVGNQRLANAFVICAGEPVEQHDRTVTIKTRKTLDAGNGSGLQRSKGDRFKLAKLGELFNRKSGF